MSCIHYKFKSSLGYDSVTFDGLHLSLSDLKKAISQQKRLKPGEFDLEITNAQTGDVYKKNDELIAKNTSVIVSRVPVNNTKASSTQKSWEAFKLECAKVKEIERQKTLGKQIQVPDIAHAPASEIDKIKAVIDQSTKGFEPSNFVGKYQAGVPNDHYTCKRCGQKGHYVSNCPNTNPEDRYVEPRYKRTTGIPSTMLTIVDDPLHPGALLTHHGQFAVPTVDVLGYREVKKERPPFLPLDKSNEPEKKNIPQELLCHICEDLCVDAAIAPCCGTSFCDECLREVLLESDDHKCPSCKETNVSPDKIVPNRSMRLAVTNFLNDTGYTKAKKRRSSSQGRGDGYFPTPTSNLSQTPPSPGKQDFNAIRDFKPAVVSSTTTYQEPDKSLATSSTNVSVQPFVPRSNATSQEQRPQFNHHANYSRHPYPHSQYTKPWRFNYEHPGSAQGKTISTISRRPQDGGHYYNKSHVTEPPPASQNVDTSVFNTGPKTSGIGKSLHIEPISSGNSNALTRPNQELKSMKNKNTWPAVTNQMLQKPNMQQLNNASVSLLALGAAAVLGAGQQHLLMPSHGQQYPAGFPFNFPPQRPNLPPMLPTQAQSTGAPLSRVGYYQQKRKPETAQIPEKKPVDVFESFADYTKRRSRTPERRRSYSRSRSRSWSKRGSRTPSISPKKARSRSLSPRNFSPHARSRSRQRSSKRSRSKSTARSPKRSRSRSGGPRPAKRSRSRSGPRPLNRSRSKSAPRPANNRSRSRSAPRPPIIRSRSRSGPRPTNRSPTRLATRPANRSRSLSGPRSINRSRSRSGPRPTNNRSRSRSFESSRLPRHHPNSVNRLSRSRTRSLSGPRLPKALSKSPHPSLSPHRKSPLPPIRSRSRSFGHQTRSRSKSWTKRARSRSFSRPRSPRPYSRSPRRSPKLSPYRSPLRKRSLSPRKRSHSFSPLRRSPFRSKSRSPLSKRRLSRSRTRSPIRRRSYTPQMSPRRSTSPYRKPLAPIPYKRQTPPFRGRGGYRGRGRGNFAYRDKFRNNRSPPKAAIPPVSNITLSTGNLPPVPYFPQMGLPPPEEYFKYNPDGYQEFVRSFYAQIGPQTQSWAQNQNFPLPTNDRFPVNIPGPNMPGIIQQPAWEPVPLPPSQRPRSPTPPGVGQPQERKDQAYNKDKDSNNRQWDRERDKVEYARNYERSFDRNSDRNYDKNYERNYDRNYDRNRPRDRRPPERGRGFDRYHSRERERGDRVREDERYRARDNHRDRDNRDINRDAESSRNQDKSLDRKKSPIRRVKVEDKSKEKVKKKPEKSKEEKDTKNKDEKDVKNKEEKDIKKTKKSVLETRKGSSDSKNITITKTIPANDSTLITSKSEQKSVNSDSNQTMNAPQDKLLGDNKIIININKTDSSQVPSQPDAIISKLPAKEKKNMSKKKGDGVGGKKKVKDTSAEDGVEKKVKKTKKKKLTFGASDVDTKQGLKKKKLKRLVDYKSENCTSEDGEERALLAGSPLKKSKLAENNELKEADNTTASEKVENSIEPIKETTSEVCKEVTNVQEVKQIVKQPEIQGVISPPVNKPTEDSEKVAQELPELSKWERDDVFDYFDPLDQTKSKPQEKVMLPRSVVDKAEKFLSHKPMKNAVIVAHVTTSTKSPEPAPDKHTTDHLCVSPVQSKPLRLVFLEPRRDSKEKKQNDLQITVKTDKKKEYPDKRASSTSSKSNDHHRYHHHHHRENITYEEDQRSVVRSSSLERNLQDNKMSSRNNKDRDGFSRKDKFSLESVNENSVKDSSKRDKNESSKDKHRNRSPDPRERRQRESNTVSHSEISKSSKDLRHKLEEKNKSKSTEDHRKLSVMDESEFVPDYEDLAPEVTNDDDAAASHSSDVSTSETKELKDKKNASDKDGEKGDEKKPSTEVKTKKSKKKHKHKEKKEKHKHKKKKHKHKKDKEGKQKNKESKAV